MKRFLIATLILLLTAGLAYAKAYEVNKKAGEYSVSIKMDKNPPSVGMNNMEMAITDKSGKPVKDAKVLVDYGMPAMPGMPAMAYKADTMSHGERVSHRPQHLHEGVLVCQYQDHEPGKDGIDKVHL